MVAFAENIRFAFRLMRRSVGLTTFAILSLALGIGTNTAIFNLIHQLILKPLPVRQPEQLVALGCEHVRGMSLEKQVGVWTLFSYASFEALRDHNQTFAGVTAFQSFPVQTAVTTSASGRSVGTRQLLSAELVDESYFLFMGVPPAFGRPFIPDDRDRPVAVLTYQAWKNKFAGDPQIVGRTLDLSGSAFTIIGVAAQQFFGDRVGEEPDLWVPLSVHAQLPPKINWLHRTDVKALCILARLKPGTKPAAAAVDSTLVLQRLLRQQAGSDLTSDREEEIKNTSVKITTAANGFSSLRDQYTVSLLFVMLIVVAALLVACLNVGNLLLARAVARQREIAVRLALGANRSTLVWQMLTESVVMAMLGGIVGVFVAYWVELLLIGYAVPDSSLISVSAGYNTPMLWFTLLLSLATGLFMGIWPALRSTHIDTGNVLKGNPAAVARKLHFGQSRLLVVAQVSLAFLLVSTAVLFVKSLRQLQEVDPGFNHEYIAQLIINPEAAGFERKQLSAVYTLALHAIDAVPGVQSSTMAEFPPLSEGGRYNELRVAGGRPYNNDVIKVDEMLVGPAFFRTMGIAIEAGRDFTEADDSSAPKVAAINEGLAHSLFGKENPLGRQLIVADSDRRMLVIGVVRDTRYANIRTPSARTIYEPIFQVPAYAQAIEVRSARPPKTIIGELRTAIGSTDKNFPVSEAMPLSMAINRSFTRESLVARLASLCAAFALLLACMGLYGVVAYTVARRTSEIGIRIALGASRTNVLWMELRQSMLMVVVGLAIGIPVSLIVTRMTANQIFGVSPTDFPSLSAAALIMMVVAGLATYIPCQRGSRIDPSRALRYE